MDNTELASEAIRESQHLLSDKEQTCLWPNPLIRCLEKIEPQLALRWAIQVYRELLPTRRVTGSEEQQLKWLSELESLISRAEVADYCNEIAYKIWENDPNRNLPERGIARLYWALQNHQIGLIEIDYRFQIAGALALLVDSEKPLGDMDEAAVERAILIFRQLEGQSKGSGFINRDLD